MAWSWLDKIVSKIASEVHKSKIDEFEKRILAMEQKQAVILKTIEDNQKFLEKLDDRIYKANLESASAVGAIKTLIQNGTSTNSLNQDRNNE